jgi:hypothetical protein
MAEINLVLTVGTGASAIQYITAEVLNKTVKVESQTLTSTQKAQARVNIGATEVINITKLIPPAGYYNIDTARAAVPEILRQPGITILYAVGIDAWEARRYKATSYVPDIWLSQGEYINRRDEFWKSIPIDLEAINTAISSAINDLKNGVGGAYDTLKKIQTELELDDSQYAALITTISGKADQSALESEITNRNIAIGNAVANKVDYAEGVGYDPTDQTSKMFDVYFAKSAGTANSAYTDENGDNIVENYARKDVVADDITNAINDLKNGVGGAYDTLKKIQTELELDDSQYAALVTAIADKASNASLQALATLTDMGISGKVNIVAGKGLSTNDFTNALKTAYDAAVTAVAGKASQTALNATNENVDAINENIGDLYTGLSSKANQEEVSTLFDGTGGYVLSAVEATMTNTGNPLASLFNMEGGRVSDFATYAGRAAADWEGTPFSTLFDGKATLDSSINEWDLVFYQAGILKDTNLTIEPNVGGGGATLRGYNGAALDLLENYFALGATGGGLSSSATWNTSTPGYDGNLKLQHGLANVPKLEFTGQDYDLGGPPVNNVYLGTESCKFSMEIYPYGFDYQNIARLQSPHIAIQSDTFNLTDSYLGFSGGDAYNYFSAAFGSDISHTDVWDDGAVYGGVMSGSYGMHVNRNSWGINTSASDWTAPFDSSQYSSIMGSNGSLEIVARDYAGLNLGEQTIRLNYQGISLLGMGTFDTDGYYQDYVDATGVYMMTSIGTIVPMPKSAFIAWLAA